MPLSPHSDDTGTPTALGNSSNTPSGNTSASGAFIIIRGPTTSRYGDGNYGDGLYGTGGRISPSAHANSSGAFTSHGPGSGSPTAITDATATLSPH